MHQRPPSQAVPFGTRTDGAIVEIEAPGANHVELSGDFTQWKPVVLEHRHGRSMGDRRRPSRQVFTTSSSAWTVAPGCRLPAFRKPPIYMKGRWGFFSHRRSWQPTSSTKKNQQPQQHVCAPEHRERFCFGPTPRRTPCVVEDVSQEPAILLEDPVSPRRALLFLFIAVFGHLAPLHAQGNSDIIRGRVIGPDKKPVENVTVTATSLVDQTSRTSKTNKDGRFTIIFAGGGGDYMMAYTSIGFSPMRFEVKREVDEDVLIADATIGKTAVSLDAVRVTAGRERPDRNGNGTDVGGREQTLNTNNVPIDVLGDLSAMAATLPGITLIPGVDGGASGFSVLGLGADQNNITLNGLNFGGTDLPRDATTQTRVTTSSFDPSRGGFSGAQIALRTTSGNNYRARSLHQTVDAPTLQYTDADRPAARTAVHQPPAQRRRVGTDLARQGLLFVLVAARPPDEQSSGFAQHRSARARARRRVVRLRVPR